MSADAKERPRAFYDFPAIYDAVHLADTPSEASVVIDAVARHGRGGRDWLEPACGTGRHLAFLSSLGFRVTGYDVNPRALAYARRRLKGDGARVVKAGMADFRSPASFDAAFSLIGTFRHLLTEREALKHLRLTAEALRPGGVYVVGLDLVGHGPLEADEEGWTVSHRGRKLSHILMSFPPDSRRREKLVNFVTVETSRGSRVLQDEYELRSYDAAQWRALIKKSPLRLEAVYDQEGQPTRLEKSTRYALFVLKRPEARRRPVRSGARSS